mgnify:CR=1 FL=1
MKLLKQEDIIHAEDRKYGTKALVVNHVYSKYDGALTEQFRHWKNSCIITVKGVKV